MNEKIKNMKKAFLCAFPYTIPIFAGFWFLGMIYGIYMNVSGFSFWYPMVMSLIIFAGSIEFVAVNMLLGAFNPASPGNDPDDQRQTFILRNFHAGQIPGNGMEEDLSDLRYV